MGQALSPGDASKQMRTVVCVRPAIGGPWLGMTVDAAELGADVAGVIEMSPGYVLVRCSDPLSAPGLVAGQVYLVLSRFVV